MAFAWFAKKKNTADKALHKAHKLATQARWAEALSYYEDAANATEQAAEACSGMRTCREQLVSFNLAEARAFCAAGEDHRAREHAALALDLAADQEDLAAQARQALGEIGTPAPQTAAEPPGRLFEPRCGGCASSCTAEAGTAEQASAGEELFDFYLDSLTPAERDAFAHLGQDFRRGFVLLQQGETEAARPPLQASATHHAALPGPRYALGLLAAIEGDDAGALGHFEACLQLDPDFSPAALHRADVLREAGRSGDAAEFLIQWCEKHPDDREALSLLARALVEDNNPERALATLDQLRDSAEEFRPRDELLRAAILSRTGDSDGATKTYQAVVARHPDLLEALVPLGQILLRQGGAAAESAAELFKHCRRIDPEHGWWHLLRVAEAYQKRGWHQEARDLLATAREELPNTPEARAEWEALNNA